MIAGQLGKITGVPVEGDEFFRQTEFLPPGIGSAALADGPAGHVLVVLLFTLTEWRPDCPGRSSSSRWRPWWSRCSRCRTTGSWWSARSPPACRRPAIPSRPRRPRLLILPALGIALVGYTDNVLTARAFAPSRDRRSTPTRNGPRSARQHRRRRCSTASRSAAAAAAPRSGAAVGSRTQLYSLVALVLVLLTLVVAGPLLASFPKAALGALVIFAALRLIDVAELRRFGRVPAQRVPAGGADHARGARPSASCTACWRPSPCRSSICCAGGPPTRRDPGVRAGNRRDARRRRLPAGAPGSRAWSSTATTRRCSSPTPRTSAAARWPPSTGDRGRRSTGSC